MASTTFSGPVTSTNGFLSGTSYINQPLVTSTASSLTLDPTTHGGAIVVLNPAAGVAVTLPAATGTEDVYRILIGTTVGASSTIKVAGTSDTYVGWVSSATTTAGAGLHEAAGGTDDTITMNGTTTGGIVGSYLEFTDYASGKWLVKALLVGSGSLATTLSASV